MARAMAKAPEDRYDSCRDLVRDLEYALNASVEVGGASHAQGRPGARHSASAYPVDDATTTSEQARAGRGAPPAAPPEQGPDSGETRGWVSHPSLPPGAITPPGGLMPCRWGPTRVDRWRPPRALAGDAAGLDEIDELDEIDVLEPDDLQGGEEPPWEDEEEEAPVEPVRRRAGGWGSLPPPSRWPSSLGSPPPSSSGPEQRSRSAPSPTARRSCPTPSATPELEDADRGGERRGHLATPGRRGRHVPAGCGRPVGCHPAPPGLVTGRRAGRLPLRGSLRLGHLGGRPAQRHHALDAQRRAGLRPTTASSRSVAPPPTSSRGCSRTRRPRVPGCTRCSTSSCPRAADRC